MASLRFALRAARLLLHVAFGLLLVALMRGFTWTGHIPTQAWAQRWLRRLMRIIGLRYQVSGSPQPTGQMIVCNHVSWLDIPLVGAALCTRFVAKSEIQHWPVAGAMGNVMGTFYLRRGAGGSKPLLDRLCPHLATGGSVVVFPEGTTTEGRDVLPFHPRLFSAAHQAPCLIQPVALYYHGPNAALAPFVGDDTLVAHIIRLLKAPGLAATLIYCPPLDAQQFASRHALAAAAEQAIRAALLAAQAAALKSAATVALVASEAPQRLQPAHWAKSGYTTMPPAR